MQRYILPPPLLAALIIYALARTLCVCVRQCPVLFLRTRSESPSLAYLSKDCTSHPIYARSMPQAQLPCPAPAFTSRTPNRTQHTFHHARIPSPASRVLGPGSNAPHLTCVSVLCLVCRGSRSAPGVCPGPGWVGPKQPCVETGAQQRRSGAGRGGAAGQGWGDAGPVWGQAGYCVAGDAGRRRRR